MPGSAHRRVFGYSLAMGAASAALFAPVAHAATVTIGSPMNAGTPFSYTRTGGTATLANIALGEPGANVTSPVTGTIVRWRVTTTGIGQYSLRVLRPAGSGRYNAVGTDAQIVSSQGAQTFPTGIPIQAGDLLGVDIPTDGVDGIAAATAANSNFAIWSPSVGSTATQVSQSNDGLELYLNADVDYTPASDGLPASPRSPTGECKKQRKHKRSASEAKSKCTKNKIKKN